MAKEIVFGSRLSPGYSGLSGLNQTAPSTLPTIPDEWMATELLFPPGAASLAGTSCGTNSDAIENPKVPRKQIDKWILEAIGVAANPALATFQHVSMRLMLDFPGYYDDEDMEYILERFDAAKIKVSFSVGEGIRDHTLMVQLTPGIDYEDSTHPTEELV